jgi:hypothetical protein
MAPVSSSSSSIERIGCLWQRTRALHRFFALAAILVAAAVLAASTLQAHGSATREASAATSRLTATQTLYPALSQSELAQWNTETSTPQGRATIVAGFRKVLGDHAKFGFGPLPAAHVGGTIQLAAFDRSSMQYGVSGNHFWFILTDNEVQDGLGWSLKAACFWALPLAGALICGTIITAVKGASYGTATNHGVWGAVYWAPPHIVIGRW